MPVPDGAHTHGSGGSGLGALLVIAAAVALAGPAARVAGDVLATVGEVLKAVLIAAACLGGSVLLALGAIAGYRIWRWRQRIRARRLLATSQAARLGVLQARLAAGAARDNAQARIILPGGWEEHAMHWRPVPRELPPAQELPAPPPVAVRRGHSGRCIHQRRPR